jgi:hypothetical protein
MAGGWLRIEVEAGKDAGATRFGAIAARRMDNAERQMMVR